MNNKYIMTILFMLISHLTCFAGDRKESSNLTAIDLRTARDLYLVLAELYGGSNLDSNALPPIPATDRAAATLVAISHSNEPDNEPAQAATGLGLRISPAYISISHEFDENSSDNESVEQKASHDETTTLDEKRSKPWLEIIPLPERQGRNWFHP